MRVMPQLTRWVPLAAFLLVGSAVLIVEENPNTPRKPATKVATFTAPPVNSLVQDRTNRATTNVPATGAKPPRTLTWEQAQPVTNGAASVDEIAFQESKARAEKGDAAAQTKLGQMYEYGIGVAWDATAAVKWYRKAAEQGNVEAQFHLGLIYDAGEGVDENHAEAMKWYRKAAEQGYPLAQDFLGAAYENGEGVAINLTEAINWYRKAAEQGNRYGQYDLARSLCDWRGLPQDYLEAIKWYQKAADQGNDDANKALVSCYSVLGWSYLTGAGVTQDAAEGVKWMRKASEQGDAYAQYNLGLSYSTGNGIAQDFAEAVKWYGKAAEQGDASAQTSLGFSYDKGLGVAANFAEAVKWYRKAADQGNADAQANLGIAYSRGEGVPENDIEAYKWSSLAAAQGNERGAEQRGFLAQSMSRGEIVEAQRLSSEFVAHKEAGPSNRGDGQDAVAVANLPRFTGTGFFVTEDGSLLTCYHVVQDAARIAVRTKSGTFAATLVKADKANDVALLKVAGKSSALPVAPSRGVKLGESVFTIGFPNIELQGFAPKLTKGEISSLTGVQDDPREFQISVAVQPGNSGGPLVDQYGNVVGIVAARLADVATLETTGSLPQNVNYAVKSSVLNVLLESLPEISAKLVEPNPAKDRKFEDVEKEAESAVALVLVY